MQTNINGVAIHYEVTGNGPVVLLLHGFPDTGRIWRHQVPTLVEAGFRVVVPDQRGHGRSDHPLEIGSYAMPFLIADALGVLDDLGVGQASIVGHDWGAGVAWALSALHPQRVDRLVALSVGHPAAFAAAGLAQRQKSWYMLLFQFPGIAEQWLNQNEWSNFRTWAQHPDTEAVIAELEASNSLTSGLNWYRANLPPKSILTEPPALPPIRTSTLGVWSSGDIALTELQMTASKAYVRGPWQYERLDNVGHWIQLEAPDAINRLLVDFLTRPH